MNNLARKIMAKALIFSILFVSVMLTLMSSAVKAQNDGWTSSLVVPGSQTLVTATADFPECLTVETYFQKDWYHCKDTKHTSKMGWDTVWAKVHKDVDFTISKPGRIYVIFTSKVAKDVFYYGDPTVGISYRGKDGKWQSAWLGGAIHSVAYHGGKVLSTSPITGLSGPPPLKYKINPDGTVNIYSDVVHYGPGSYRLTIISATRFNNNTAEKTYVPSRAEAKVIFIPDGTKIIGSELECPASKQESYNLYTSYFDQLQKLMRQGRGDKPEAQGLYGKYKFYRDCYNQNNIYDSDGDGVPDDIDKCSNTKVGATVDSTGCVKKEKVVILLYLPKTKELLTKKSLVFSGEVPDFRTAKIHGNVRWENLFHKGVGFNEKIYAYIKYKGKYFKKASATTDANGNYQLQFTVNRSGKRDIREFKIDVCRYLSDGSFPPGPIMSNTTPPNTGSSTKEIPKKVVTASDLKVRIWNYASALNAHLKDIDLNKHGGRGTPNMDQWRKNHKSGRDSINALKYIIDIATSPATATAQNLENASILYKRLTGKNLPFVKKYRKNSWSAPKAAGQAFWQHLDDLKNAGIEGYGGI